MERQKDKNGSGQQSPFGFGAPRPTSPTSSTSINGRRQQPPMTPTFFGNATGDQQQHYAIVNGVYYSNPQTPTMQMSPPPGFAVHQIPPQYQPHHHQIIMQNPQHFYPGGFAQQQQQQIPIFNNNNFVAGSAEMLGLGAHHYQQQFNSLPLQQEYSQQGVGVNDHLYNNNVTTTTGNSSSEDRSSPALLDKNQNQSKSGIKPLIDNIVGSMMFNGVNGAYTHFGPSSSTSPYPENQHEVPIQFGGVASSSSPVMFGGSSTSATAATTAQQSDIIKSKQMNENSRKQQESPNDLRHSFLTHGAAQQQQQISGRSTTPNDIADCNSRPQTPNKPSYSEILAKNSITGATTPIITYRKVASSSSSTTTSQQQTLSSKGSSSKENQTTTSTFTRKPDSTGSSASSSCTSLSSSPIAKQKSLSLSQTIMGKLFTTQSFGKENSTVGGGAAHKSSSSSNSYRTPSSTPTHQRKSVPEIKPDETRKILASQNSGNMKSVGNKQSATIIKKIVNKISNNSTTTNGSSETMHMDEPPRNQKIADDDGDWKTYSRSKHSTTRSSLSNVTSSTLYSGNKTPTPPPLQSDDDKSCNSSESANSSNNNNKPSTASISGDDGLEADVDGDVSRRESLTDRKSGTTNSNNTTSGGSQVQRKNREKERPKNNKKDGRNGTVRRVERIIYLWAATVISALAWLLKLVTDVFTLSISVGTTLMEDFYSWWLQKALPAFLQQFHMIEETVRVSFRKLKQSCTWKIWPFRRRVDEESNNLKKNSENLLAALGPEKNIHLSNADETLKRLLSCKGQDPYSILGVRSDSSDETIRRYYKKQAVQVHPDKTHNVGAEEAFKVLGRAFELVGESSKRQEYHNNLLEAHAKEQVYGEIGKLLEQLRKKMEIATSSIRCTKCNLRHKKNKTDRPLFAARFCTQCNIHHAAREGELWAESKGWFGLSWNYFTCMDCHIWEINEWAKCQKKNLLHIKADSHNVMYRLVAGGGGNGSGQQPSPGTHDGQHDDPDDDWDSLINNLCKTSGGGVPGSKGDHFYQQGGGTGAGNNFYTGNASGTGNNNSTTSNTNGAAAGRKRKGKRK